MRDLALVLASLALVAFGLRSLPAAPVAANVVAPPAPASEAAPTDSAALGSSARPPAAELVGGTCTFPDNGFGDYVEVRTNAGWDVIARQAAVAPDGSYDLLVHLHAGDAVRKIVAPLAKPIVIATKDRGDSSGDYAATFTNRKSWDDQIAAIDRATSEVVGRPAHARRIAISSFSAGYAATREALMALPDEPTLTGVLLLDSLYGSYAAGSRSVDATGLEPFEQAARRALEKPRFSFILTHSEVVTDGYASTGEVATTLLDRLVVRSSLVTKRGPRGLTRVAEERGFVVRGYAGNDKGAHCAHLALLPELIDVWQSHL